ncbi:SGNH/GDSL hydrolase family protein [Aquimarina algiphila]|uniref:SGNH/GDSL hydrolase family protein n=1 Tax=Aquimarina algiphila TaxID=2047982 RepID=A0A554VLG3_9FLAO|nr:SGNH/GDSL hydrolase family protein [Aquimarina algiphila]TSE08942.1 SGNH/GDSL hydrolase family protein [Aquimarina algiphila]
MRPLHIIFTLLWALSINSQTETKKILFLGNSLTYSNNLPKILEYMAKNCDESIKSTTLCFPNYALEDHWIDGTFQKIMSKKSFDYVIAQQGPSSQPLGKKMLLTYGAKIKSVCQEKNTKFGFFMVWPSKQHYYTFDGVIANHKEAAKVNQSLLFPVGVLWKEYEKHNNFQNLYDYDNFHPSTAGSFLAALTIFHGLYPDKNLSKLQFKKYKKWVKDKKSFHLMIKLVNQ